MRSNFRQAVAAVREGFLLTPPHAFMWHGDRYWIDDVPVSERVYDLARDGDLAGARAAWLAEFDAAAGLA